MKRTIDLLPGTTVETLPSGRGVRFELPAESSARRMLLEVATTADRVEVMLQSHGGPYLVLQYSVAAGSGLTTFDLVEPSYFAKAVGEVFESELAFGESDLARVESIFAAIGALCERGVPDDVGFCYSKRPPAEAAIMLKCGNGGDGSPEFVFTADGVFLGVSWFAPDETMVFTPRLTGRKQKP